MRSAHIYQTDLGAIHYWTSRTEEEKPWLVFLPGLTADHRLFDKELDALGQRFSCLVWDAPGHGASRPFRLDFSMEDLARYLQKILERENIQRPVLIGQSLGGYICQIYMRLYPDTAAGFISIDSCSMHRRYYTGAELFLLKHTKWMYLSIPWNWLKHWGIQGTARSEYGRSVMKQMIESYEKRDYCALADHGFRILAQAVEAGYTYSFSCPVLLLCGEKDSAGSGKRYNRSWTKTEGYPLVWIPGAGHNANTDAPELVNQIIADFVQKEVIA